MDHMINEIYVRNQGEVICTETRHLWWVMFYPRDMMAEEGFGAVNGNIYTVCSGESAMDKWCSAVENELGMRTKTGVNCARDHNTLVCGDFVVIYSYPAKMMEAIEKAYARVRKAGVRERAEVYSLLNDLFGKVEGIAVTVIKNPALAESIRGNIMAEFGRP
jgi:hypothetical protein